MCVIVCNGCDYSADQSVYEMNEVQIWEFMALIEFRCMWQNEEEKRMTNLKEKKGGSYFCVLCAENTFLTVQKSKVRVFQ